MTELIPKNCLTAAAEEGRYFGVPGAINLVSGRPICVQRFSLEQDHPAWRTVDPRCVRFYPRRILRELAPNRVWAVSRRRYRRNVSGHEVEVAQRRVRDLRWLAGLIGWGLLRQVARLPLRSGPFLLVWLAQRIEGYRQLLDDTPMLAVLIANCPEPSPSTVGLDDLALACRDECEMPRREIVVARGLPRKALTGLCKIAPAGADPLCVPGLRRTLGDSVIRKRFNHATCIGPDGIRFFSDERLFRCVSGRFLRLLAKSDRQTLSAKYAPMLEKALALTQSGCDTLGRKMFTSPDQLSQWYERTLSQIGVATARRLQSMEFPVAPVKEVPGTIEQIGSGRRLIQEALAMEHCCASLEYVERLQKGELYLFSVGGSGLQRCTVAVEPVLHDRVGNRRCAIVEVAGKHNAVVAARTLAALCVWAEDQEMASGIATPVSIEQPCLPGLSGEVERTSRP